MKEQLENVKHDYIRYANCWEDADVLIKGLEINPNDKVLSIGSAGDNSFSLLAQGPELVVAVDINPIQLNLIELKKAAFQALNHEEFLAFLGFIESKNRAELYGRVKIHLSDELAAIWDLRLPEIESGIIHAGKFEKYFNLFKRRILPLVHTRKRVNELFREKNAEDQEIFFKKKWNNWRWRMLFKLFFSKFVMGKFGRDPAFLKEVEVPVSEFILEQSRKHLSSVNCQNNYFLHFIMKGDFGDRLPHYARKENFDLIKENLERLVIFNGLAEDAFREYSGFTKFNLSNIFEYMNLNLFTAVTKNFVDNTEANARFAYWNLMVPRKMHLVNESVVPDGNTSNELTKEDMGFFYGSINIDVKK
jgi:S-adenosylmethionine-diacylglycerol 3-amino-3-carboxypropyl transferase